MDSLSLSLSLVEPTLGFCGTNCSSTCEPCTTAVQRLEDFYSTEEPAEVPALVNPSDEDQHWEDTVMAARALDEAEEAARTGMVADNAELDEDNHCDCDCCCGNWDYDDRQDDYDDEWNTGLDWNEGGYFD